MSEQQAQSGKCAGIDGWKVEDYDASADRLRDILEAEVGLFAVDTTLDELLTAVERTLFERRQTIETLRAQYDRRVARYIAERRSLRAERDKYHRQSQDMEKLFEMVGTACAEVECVATQEAGREAARECLRRVAAIREAGR